MKFKIKHFIFSFLDSYNPKQFEIIQLCASHGKVPKNIENESGYINGKWVYARILIKHKFKEDGSLNE